MASAVVVFGGLGKCHASAIGHFCSLLEAVVVPSADVELLPWLSFVLAACGLDALEVFHYLCRGELVVVLVEELAPVVACVFPFEGFGVVSQRDGPVGHGGEVVHDVRVRRPLSQPCDAFGVGWPELDDVRP